IVGPGLISRSYLSKINLLLVARISAVIITVILIISVFTVVAFKVGLTEGLTITFFPMIILSWTIERMSILWEEEGAKEVLLQGGGSLFTAILIYLAMTNTYVQHLTFNFIGLQLVVLAAILLLGTYTGYRISELRRFKPLVEEK
ncbi:7TM domain-containing protein, partial [Vibrio cholerae]|uniref:7TM domain-containing protein n=1 Tax=Vibrio cholerae TaxID=666 RepID=UPI0026464DAF